MDTHYVNYTADNTVTGLLRRVYGWMAIALGITGLTAFIVGNSPALLERVVSTGPLLLLILIQLGLVIFLNARIATMSYTTALISYLLYSFLNGITLSVIFLIYTQSSIATTFFICAGMFAVMALYGYYTKADLSALNSFLFMGLIGLIGAGLVNMFFKSQGFDFIIAAAGVLIFTLYTAYDVQMIKRLGQQLIGTGEEVNKAALICALKLYLDFINLFLYLLRFFGQQRRSE
ncbi:Bax inhibitor-1/YccA family protein [Candidatus Dependentiae bacterium]|nr:Bax inhibitor-1/YccA family protein [Candidatus Dependentiae bacterium]